MRLQDEGGEADGTQGAFRGSAITPCTTDLGSITEILFPAEVEAEAEAARALAAPQACALGTHLHTLIVFHLPGQDWLRGQVSLV